MKKMNPVKEELKKLAETIRSIRTNTIALQKSQDRDANLSQSHLAFVKREFRHKHIAYSLVKGRTLAEIEKPRQNNQPNMTLVEKYRKEYVEKLTVHYENVRHSA